MHRLANDNDHRKVILKLKLIRKLYKTKKLPAWLSRMTAAEILQ